MDILRPLRKTSVSVRKLEDECLLYDEQTDKLHVINETAGFVWDLCDGSHSLHDIEDRMREAYSVADDRNLADDLRRIVDSFTDLELLQLGPVEGS